MSAPVENEPQPVGNGDSPVGGEVVNLPVSRSTKGETRPVISVDVAVDKADTDASYMAEPWAGDTDMRAALMRERFGDQRALNRERTKPTYSRKKGR